MAKYPGYAESRRAFGLNVLGTLVVEIEADDGTVGFAVTTAGEPGAWIVEKHLARFLEGQVVTDIEKMWDQMYLSTLFYGRKGLVVNVISAVDLALYDLLGRIRQEPVYQLLGGKVREELVFYATGARPDKAKELGFIGGKLPLQHGPAETTTGAIATCARPYRPAESYGSRSCRTGRACSPLLLGESVPVNGRMVVPETPGFGVELNPEIKLNRPYEH